MISPGVVWLVIAAVLCSSSSIISTVDARLSNSNNNAGKLLEFGILTWEQQERRCDRATANFTMDKCGSKPECTCFDELFDLQTTSETLIAENTTCEVLEEQICGIVEKANDCCSPCTGTVSRMMLCSDNVKSQQESQYGANPLFDWADSCSNNMTRQCLSDGIALAPPYTEDASTTARVIGIIAAAVFVGVIGIGGGYMLYTRGCSEDWCGYRHGRPMQVYMNGVNGNSPR